jgi:hypothetical protein
MLMRCRIMYVSIANVKLIFKLIQRRDVIFNRIEDTEASLKGCKEKDSLEYKSYLEQLEHDIA